MHMLLRSGVSKLRLVDFDLVSVSSLNRHALATRSDVGTSKGGVSEITFPKRYIQRHKLRQRYMLYDDQGKNCY